METLALLRSNQELSGTSLEYRFQICESNSAGGFREDDILALPIPNFPVHPTTNYAKNNLKSHAVFLEFCVFLLAAIL